MRQNTIDSIISPEELLGLNDLADRFGSIVPIISAFLGGSLVEGWGNSTSDIDVLVLLNSIQDISQLKKSLPDVLQPQDSWVDQGESLIVSSVFGSRRSDIEVHALEGVERAYSRLLDSAEPANFPNLVSQGELELFRDLVIGIPVIGEANFTSLKNTVDNRVLCRSIRRRSEYQASAHLEDLQGALDSGNVVSALLTSRSSLGSSVDAWIAYKGHSNPKEKWRGTKLLDLEEREMLARYLELECGSGSSRDADILSDSRARALASQEFLLFDI
ncbi:Uncharacterised protein [Corynebacterium striatum]|uniref:Polymerase nucleotidyl transferase domain-containing protein n=1 Tax=Corynebacterium striatum TaxID=43770 RepID=A0AAQ1TXS7_CORST|nr:nucleotidyltransferase domain-containing protein [Corynebacterium striatum]EEI78988.1 nucleotidyltransferase domain protein [Corynebacterium striatum ATCC 6940]QQE52176.1 nucleotidyltransferase domain-containing protein [Corynebacterium striatum]STD63250.1 Uncharacterised protein [Corynebacterium striatum]GEA43119.1 hypothetical protein Cst04h_12890 [Corynebacterium striatum]HCD3017412.1 nucleotidyltransferase domain-containing protein [Corynebacterium striatum]